MKKLENRLAWAREQKKLTQAELAKLAGVSQSTIGNLEAGIRFSARRIANIADALGVSAIWLAEGIGEIRRSTAADQDIDVLDYRLDQARADAIATTNPEFKRVKLRNPDGAGLVHIRKVKLRLSAGVTGFIADPDFEEAGTVTLDPVWVHKQGFIPDRLVATTVKGESMEPALYEGDVVVINTAATDPVDGDVFAVNYEGEAVVKRLSRDAGEWWLTSDNLDQRKFSRKLCRNGDCIIVGKVVHRQGNRI